VRRHFVDELGLDRVYPASVQPDEPIRDLEHDLRERRARKAA
jgi:hypothetical protein